MVYLPRREWENVFDVANIYSSIFNPKIIRIRSDALSVILGIEILNAMGRINSEE
jgi:hypothetical protein